MTEQTQDQAPKITPQELFEKLVNLHTLVVDIDEDIKALLTDAKDQGLEDVSVINSIAKLKASAKLEDAEGKLKSKLELIETLVG